MSCQNCSYNCCCKCEQYNGDCRYCDLQCNGSRRMKITGNIEHNKYIDYDYDYPNHYICFKCRIGWKSAEKYPHDDRRERGLITKKQLANEYYDKHDTDKIACYKCGTKGYLVGKNLRIPKKNKVKEWKLLEKLVVHSFDDLQNLECDEEIEPKFNELFANIYKDREYPDPHTYKLKTYEERWMKNKPSGNFRQKTVIFGDTHVPYPYNYPTHLREYNSFLKTLKNGKYLTKSGGYKLLSRDRWFLLKVYCQILRIIDYWEKYAKIKKTLNIDPKCNVIKEYNNFETISNTSHEIMPKNLLLHLSKFLFVSKQKKDLPNR